MFRFKIICSSCLYYVLAVEKFTYILFMSLIFRPGQFGAEVERVLGGGLVPGMCFSILCVMYDFFEQCGLWNQLATE